VGHAQAVVSEADKMAGDNLGAMPVGVRFNRWPQSSVGAHLLLEQTHIVR